MIVFLKEIFKFMFVMKDIFPYLKGDINKPATNICSKQLLQLLNSNLSDKKNKIYLESILENPPSRQQHFLKYEKFKHELSVSNCEVLKTNKDILKSFNSFVKEKNIKEHNLNYSDLTDFPLFLKQKAIDSSNKIKKTMIMIIIMIIIHLTILLLLYIDFKIDLKWFSTLLWILSIPSYIKSYTFFKIYDFFQQNNFKRCEEKDSFLHDFYYLNNKENKISQMELQKKEKEKESVKREKEIEKTKTIEKASCMSITKEEINLLEIEYLMDMNENGVFKYIADDKLSFISEKESNILMALFENAFNDENKYDSIFNNLWNLIKIKNSYNTIHKIIFKNQAKINDVVSKTLNKNNILILLSIIHNFVKKHKNDENDENEGSNFKLQKYIEIDKLINSKIEYDNFSKLYNTSLKKGYVFE